MLEGGEGGIKEWTEMGFDSINRASEDRPMWKGIVVK